MTDRPLSPEQSRSQVIDAAREIAAAMGVPVHEAWFWRASCRDGGGPPFRGQIRIGYGRAASYEASEAEIAAMLDRLRAVGWGPDPGFHSHSPVLRKGGVHAVFRAQNASVTTRGIEVLGECADMTTTAAERRRTERLDLG